MKSKNKDCQYCGRNHLIICDANLAINNHKQTMTEQELRDEFDILSIEQKIEWALGTIRHKETFGMDELNASLSRERRAKGVLLDCKKTIKEARGLIESLMFCTLNNNDKEKAKAWLENNR